MRCPSCSKFAQYDTSTDPEVELNLESVDLPEFDSDEAPEDHDYSTATAVVSGNARIVLSSECCGDELKETNFDVNLDIEVNRALDCTCDPKTWVETCEVEENGSSLTEERESTVCKVPKRGPNKGKTIKVPVPPRYQKTFYGIELSVVIKCACDKVVGEDTYVDKVQASSMDELT